MTRYDGKPFLRLLDAWVLQAMGALDDEHERALIAMEPKLREVYDTDGGWATIVAQQMAFADDMADEVRAAWTAGQRRAVAAGEPANPVAFAHAFVDAALAS